MSGDGVEHIDSEQVPESKQAFARGDTEAEAPIEDEPSEYEKLQMSRDFALGLEKFQGGLEG